MRRCGTGMQAIANNFFYIVNGSVGRDVCMCAPSVGTCKIVNWTRSICRHDRPRPKFFGRLWRKHVARRKAVIAFYSPIQWVWRWRLNKFSLPFIYTNKGIKNGTENIPTLSKKKKNGFACVWSSYGDARPTNRFCCHITRTLIYVLAD